jgi:hypothetical protein
VTAEFREAVARELTEQGRRAFTSETYSRDAVFAALREIRYSQDGDPNNDLLGKLACGFAEDLAGVVDVPPRDIASVLMAAGGAVGVLVELQGMSATTIAGLLQYAADELDQRARAGETA